MNKYYTNVFWGFASFFGIFKLFRFLYQNNISIIVYHNIGPELFDQHLKYLVKHYNIISLSDYVTSVKLNTFLQLPKRSVIITIDDGHKNNYYLLPIIKKYKITPTIYLTSHIICTNKKFWWLIPQSKKEIDNIKSLTNHKKNLYLFNKYNFSLDYEFSDEERCSLSKEEILEMNPFVDFQCHTSYHPILTMCSEEELNEELRLSKLELEKLLNKKISHISYPNGNFDANIVSKVKAMGYLSARTTKLGLANGKSDLYRLKIMGVSELNIKHRIEIDLLGLPLLIISLQKKMYNLFNKTTINLK